MLEEVVEVVLLGFEEGEEVGWIDLGLLIGGG